MRFFLSVVLPFFVLTGAAYAGDLSDVQACIEKGYQSLVSRHAIVAAVLDEMALCGLVLSEKAGSSYETLVERNIFEPLAMSGPC